MVIVLSPSFTLSAMVRNDGEGASAATTLRYYRSTDATIATSGTQVGTDAVAGLAAAGSSSQSVDLTAPDTSGTYYYGACVDAVTDESDTTNNCSSSVTVAVPEPDKPDLVVESPSVDDSGPTAGATFTLSATVRNDGVGTSPATTLRYYRSTDATIATSDTQVSTDAVAGLAAAGSSSQSVDLTAPDTSGTYYYGACVDSVTDESDTTNNCPRSVTVTVTEPAPDLVVATPTVSDSSPDAGATFTLSATVRNDGDEAAAATTLRYYRSTGRIITTSDTEVGTDEVGELAASGTSGESVSLTATLPAGTYYYGACVDAVTGESDTTNNCSSSVPVTVTAPNKPDLLIYAIVVETNPFGGTPPGGLIQMSAGVVLAPRAVGSEASPRRLECPVIRPSMPRPWRLRRGGGAHRLSAQAAEHRRIIGGCRRANRPHCGGGSVLEVAHVRAVPSWSVFERRTRTSTPAPSLARDTSAQRSPAASYLRKPP